MNKIRNVLIAGASALLFPAFISDYNQHFSYSIFPILFSVSVYLMLDYIEKQNCSSRAKKLSLALGVIYSCMTGFGYSLEKTDGIPFTDFLFLASLALFSYVFACALRAMWCALEKSEQKLLSQSRSRFADKVSSAIDWLFARPAVVVLIILACWLPCYISIFPGAFSYDAAAQFNQTENGYNGNFPMLHSVIINSILSIVHQLTGSYNAGIALYTVFQMILLSCLFCTILRDMHKQGINRLLLSFFLIYFALFPALHVLVVCTVRDVMFSGLLTYSVFLFYRFSRNKEQFWSSIKQPLLLGLVFSLTLLSRNNNAGLFMPVAIIIVCIAMFWYAGSKNRRNAVLFTIASLGSYVLLTIILTSICHPTQANIKGASSLITQPLARAYIMESEGWSDEDIEEFQKYFLTADVEYIAENADTTKSKLKLTGDNVFSFAKYWIKIGFRHPDRYLEAILANTHQMWSPASIVDGYQEAGITTYIPYDKCYFYFTGTIADPGEALDLLPSVRQFYTDISMNISYEKVPIISMLFSIGFHFWLLLNCLFYSLCHNRRELYLPLIILLGYSIISAFVPLVLLRYFSALFFSFPMVAFFTLQPDSASKCSA